MKIDQLTVIALAAHGLGLSGGDRIFIELSKQWSKIFPVRVVVTPDGRALCERQYLTASIVDFYIVKPSFLNQRGFLADYLSRIIEGLSLGMGLKLENSKTTYIYSASEFWMDSLTCWLLKIRHPQVTWVASWYQTAPNPFQGFSEGPRKRRYFIQAFGYWLVQLPIKPLISTFADYVMVNNESELDQFQRLNSNSRALVVHGAVDLSKIDEFIEKHPVGNKRYAAVFQGRFHPQKGVMELIDIWKLVIEKIPSAKLAMIGDGPLMKEVQEKIAKEKLRKNIELFGYLFDGDQKYQIFANSKLVVHPSFYDSGGMAAAEAMGFSIPAIGFNLKSFLDYYPKGMVKVKIGQLDDFASTVVDLLNNDRKRRRLGLDARKMIEKSWSWDERAQEILSYLEQ